VPQNRIESHIKDAEAKPSWPAKKELCLFGLLGKLYNARSFPDQAIPLLHYPQTIKSPQSNNHSVDHPTDRRSNSANTSCVTFLNLPPTPTWATVPCEN
jgi:hypothetical protein